MPSNRLLFISENIFRLRKEDRVVGSYLYDKFNQTIARVDGVLAESGTYLPRYLVINFGGFLTIGGKKITLPVEICEFADLGKVKTEWSKESMKDAPAPNSLDDISMDEEELILGYFDLEPYWAVNPSSKDDPENKQG
ncbi:MAG: hypothetical protein V3U37_03840 [Nitrospinaceae bacterium]